MENAPKLTLANSCIMDLARDSIFWGLKMGLLRIEDTQTREFKEQSKKFEFIQTEISVNSPAAIHKLIDLGFKIVESEVRMSWGFRRSVLRPIEKGVSFSRAQEFDAPRIKELYAQLNLQSRFEKDGNFRSERIQNFYHRLIDNSIKNTKDEECFVLNHNQSAIAFCTIKYQDKFAEFGLFGVSTEYRGRGYSSMFLLQIMDYLNYKRLKGCTVVIPADHISTIKTFEKAHFRTEEISLILHWWNQIKR